MNTIQLNGIGIEGAISAIEQYFEERIAAAAKPKSSGRDPILGRIVNLPANWQKEHGYTAEWAKDITKGKVWARVADTDLYPTGQISVILLNPDGTETGHTACFEQWELSLAQQGIKEASYERKATSGATAGAVKKES